MVFKLDSVCMLVAWPCAAGVYNTLLVEAGAPTFVLSKTSLDITAFAVSLLLVFRCARGDSSGECVRQEG